MTLLAICNQEDKQKTILLGTKIGNTSHETILIRMEKSKRLKEIVDCSDILKEHLKISSNETHKVYKFKKINKFYI